MRRLDGERIDPEVAASLAAIDATLAGEPVDPKYAELAELALLLAAERPRLDPATAKAIDERRHGSRAQPSKPRRRLWMPALGGTLAALAAAVVVVVAVNSTGSSTLPGGAASSSSAASSAPATIAPTAASATTSAAASAPAHARAAAGRAAGALSLAPTTAGGTTSLQLPNNGRRTTQSAQLSLSTTPSRIDQVAQEVLDVAGQYNAIVRNSSVTATGGPGGYAQFQLSVPSANLARTMTALSELEYANVISRTDSSQDVNDQYLGTQNRLTDAQALRTALLKQLANAYTDSQIQSLNAQIHDADATISSAQAQLRSLNGQINFSPVSVSLSAGAIVPAAPHSGGGFTIGKAAHDAKRVLTVVAGGALIALAVLLPLALVLALLGWIWAALRRRRREHALDMA